jgi:hypothetical protein
MKASVAIRFGDRMLGAIVIGLQLAASSGHVKRRCTAIPTAKSQAQQSLKHAIICRVEPDTGFPLSQA